MNFSKENLLRTLAYYANGDWDQETKYIKERRLFSENEFLNATNFCHADVITLGSDNYPELLTQIYKPPYILFYYGNIELLKENYTKISVVGPREPDKYTIKATTEILNGVLTKSKNIAVVSGMAKGIDSLAQRIAMKNGNPTISVLGCGIDVCYPEESKDIYEYCKQGKGLLLSEYPGTLVPAGKNFLKRNRIITGLSPCLFVPAGKTKSGTANSVAYACEQNKDVYCLAQPIDSEFQLTNEIIKNGAYLVTGSDDFDSYIKISK